MIRNIYAVASGQMCWRLEFRVLEHVELLRDEEIS